MATNFPSAIDTLVNPLPASDTSVVPHSAQHANANDAIEAIEAKVGADGSAVTTSHDYKLSSVTGVDKAIGATQTVTVSNKTLSSPKITVGSDAIGDTLYNSSGATGVQTRIPIGSVGQIFTSDGVKPVWSSPTSTNTNYAVDTGVADAYVVTLSPALGLYSAGVLVQFKASNANTGTSTVNVNGLGVKTIKKLDGATNLASGDIASGMIVECEYDGTNFIMLNPSALSLNSNGDGSNLTGVLKTNYSQQAVGLSTATFANANTTVTSNTAGTELCYCHPTAAGSTTWAIGRLAKDSVTGQWYTVETTTFVAGTSNTNGSQCGLVYLGSYIYMSVYDGGAPNRYLYRFSNSNLTAGATAMTLSGTGGNAGAQSMYTNGTDIVIYGGGTNWYRYTISGTTYTNAQTLTGPASAVCTVFDGTNVYSYDGATISKYAVTLGAASATAALRYAYYVGTQVRAGAGIHFINSSAINIINSGLSTQNLLFFTPFTKI